MVCKYANEMDDTFVSKCLVDKKENYTNLKLSFGSFLNFKCKKLHIYHNLFGIFLPDI